MMGASRSRSWREEASRNLLRDGSRGCEDLALRVNRGDLQPGTRLPHTIMENVF